MTELSASRIYKSFGPVRVLEDVSLSLVPGEVRCLAGENGSGKSTLIKIFSGIEPADSGDVCSGGQVIDADARVAIEAGLSVIYQDFALFPNLTVAENIAFLRDVAGRNRWHNRRRQRALAREALERMAVEIDPDELVELLPVASKQLVAIARALANDARIIVMDEPTTALTRSEIAHLAVIVETLKAQGVAFLFVSHKIEEIFTFCDTITVLRDGRVVAEGAVSEFDTDRIGEAMTGRAVSGQRLPRDAAAAAPTPVLEARGLTRVGQYQDVDLALNAGEIVAIVGLLGSGRTELALSVFGMLQPEGGELRIDGASVAFSGPAEAMAAGVAYVPEDRLTEGLFPGVSISDNITVASLDQSTRSGVLNRGGLLERAQRAVERLRIRTPGVHQPVSTLSGGNQQRVVLARWLQRAPKVLILNGPTVGVDVGSKREIHELLLAISRDGAAVLVLTDDIGEALTLSDRLLVMRRGRISTELDPTETDEDSLYELVVKEEAA